VFRGEVWDVRFPVFGEHPAVILSVNAYNQRLGHVVVVPITGTLGPVMSHVTLTLDSGLTKYDESYADITTLQSIAKGRLLRRRGLLARPELAHIEATIRIYLGV
jgi:mRNA interferase MazF